ncbi:hypothetical protein [Paracandidimonas lactea]|uniref:hypothetical protein n=1 Tax=Paracandidimonas lactea TaxID=2895524 RepID=UPI001F369354|nr:hypothetical protein [Paracandidimonas lactea]
MVNAANFFQKGLTFPLWQGLEFAVFTILALLPYCFDPSTESHYRIMRNVSRNLSIGIAFIAVLMFGLLAQSAQACTLPSSMQVQTLERATGHMPCPSSTDAYSVGGSNCLFVDQAGTDTCITQAWIPRSETSIPSYPDSGFVLARPHVVPAFQAVVTAIPTAPTIRHSRRNSSLSILHCSFQI